MTSRPRPPSTVRVLVVLFALALGLVGGLVGGILSTAAGSNIANATSTGFVAFAGTVSLALVIGKSLDFL